MSTVHDCDIIVIGSKKPVLGKLEHTLKTCYGALKNTSKFACRVIQLD